MDVQGRRARGPRFLALKLAPWTVALAAIAAGAAHAAPVGESQLRVGDRSSAVAQEARAAEARVSARQAEARAAARAAGNGADLAIWAFADNPVPTSEGLTIFAAVENWGPQAATNVTFKVVLPEGVTGASPKPSPGVTCTGPAPTERTVTCSVAAIAVEDYAEVEIGATAPAMDGVRTGTASITAQTPADPWPGDNSTSYEIEVRSDADLMVWQSADKVAPGANVTFEVVVENWGPKTATDVKLENQLPTRHTLQSWEATAGTVCTAAPTTLTCETASLTRGDAVEVRITVSGLEGEGTVRNVARVTASSPSDPDLDDNEDVQIGVVGNPARADLAVFADGPSDAAADTRFTYFLQVDNLGPQTAKGVVVTNKLPAGVTYERYEITRSQPPQGTPPPPLGTCTHANGTVTCELGEVTAAAWAEIQIRVRPGSGAVGTTITNVAEVAAMSPVDHDPDSDRSKTRTLVHPAGTVDLAVYADGPESAPVGTSFSYYVAVDNYGPAALAPTLTAVLPAGVTFQSVTPSTGCAYTASSRTLTCVLAELQPWDWHELEISVLPTAPGDGKATLNVSGGTEMYPADNAGSVTTKVLGHVLNVQTTGPGAVTSTPGGIACGTDCSEAYPEGANVTLVASPNAGSSFLGWSGACTGTASTCIVAMTEQRAVAAAFATPPPPPPPPPPSDTTAPGVTIKISPPRLALALKNGVPARLACNEACQARVQLKLAAATAARLKLPAVVGTASKALAAGAASKVTVKLKPAAKRKLAKLRSVRLTLVVTAKDAAGNVRTASKGLTLRR